MKAKDFYKIRNNGLRHVDVEWTPEGAMSFAEAYRAYKPEALAMCPSSCACGGHGGPVLVTSIGPVANQSEWICHTCKKRSSADGMPQHYDDCQYAADEAAWQNAWHNSVGRIENTYPHARDWTNVAHHFWREALAYERNRNSTSEAQDRKTGKT